MKLFEQINILAEFCGMRDVSALTQSELNNTFGFKRADVMVLFGGSILAGGDILAEAIKNQIAKTYLIVGGAGHTTETLRIKMNEIYPGINTKNLSEAEIFNKYINLRYNLSADYLECESTNCGNNITLMLKLLDENKISYKNIILAQDATMQRRMYAGLTKYRPEILAINYATYQAKIVDKDSELVYDTNILGMWNVERYVNLLLGEIPRLTDDVNGYGPNGKNFIAHVDIPLKVQEAFEFVSKFYKVRQAIKV